MILLPSLALAHPANCDTTVSSAELELVLQRAEEAIAVLEVEDLGDAAKAARLLAPCVGQPLSRAEVLRLYRIDGIALFVVDDWAGAVANFGLARALDPDWVLPESLGPPMKRIWDAVPPPSGATTPLPPPSEGWLVVDGERAEQAPTDRSYVLQWIREDGSARATWLVAKGQIPTYPKGEEKKRKKRD